MSEFLNNDRYRVLQTLGRGGCGETYLAEDTQMPSRRRCVIKRLRPTTNDPAAKQIIEERFGGEAVILEKLGASHDQIPTLQAYFIEGDEFYLVQDWIEGQSLMQRVQMKGMFSESEVRNLLVSLLPVLDYVHAQRIIHRDIKPDNIMLRERDGKPVLIDFGAVKEVGATIVDAYGSPASSIVIGTPVFMSLEQTAGKPMFASDLYSLGLTAIYLLTGKRPNDMNDLETGEVAWRKHAPQVSTELATILNKAIRPYAHERYRTAREMLMALQINDNALYGTVPAPQPAAQSNAAPATPRPVAPVRDTPRRVNGFPPNPPSPQRHTASILDLENDGSSATDVTPAPSKLTIQYPAIWLPILLWGGVGFISGLISKLLWNRPISYDTSSTSAFVFWNSPGIVFGFALYMFGEYSAPGIRRGNRVFRYLIWTFASTLGWYCASKVGLRHRFGSTLLDFLSGGIIGSAFIATGGLLCCHITIRLWLYPLIIVIIGGLVGMLCLYFHTSPYPYDEIISFCVWQSSVLAAHVVALKMTSKEPAL